MGGCLTECCLAALACLTAGRWRLAGCSGWLPGGFEASLPNFAIASLPHRIASTRVHVSLYALVQLVPAVTELVISELLWLNYAAPDKPIYVYINSTGGCGGGLVGCGLVVGWPGDCRGTSRTLPFVVRLLWCAALKPRLAVATGSPTRCLPALPRPPRLAQLTPQILTRRHCKCTRILEACLFCANLPTTSNQLLLHQAQAPRPPRARLLGLRPRPPPSWTPWRTSGPRSTPWWVAGGVVGVVRGVPTLVGWPTVILPAPFVVSACPKRHGCLGVHCTTHQHAPTLPPHHQPRLHRSLKPSPPLPSLPPLLQVIGQAFGNAAMILASGKKGQRYALPNARIMTAPPRLNRSFGSVSNVMIKANELEQSTQVAGGAGGAVRVMGMMVWCCW